MDDDSFCIQHFNTVNNSIRPSISACVEMMWCICCIELSVLDQLIPQREADDRRPGFWQQNASVRFINISEDEISEGRWWQMTFISYKFVMLLFVVSLSPLISDLTYYLACRSKSICVTGMAEHPSLPSLYILNFSPGRHGQVWMSYIASTMTAVALSSETISIIIVLSSVNISYQGWAVSVSQKPLPLHSVGVMWVHPCSSKSSCSCTSPSDDNTWGSLCMRFASCSSSWHVLIQMYGG